MNWNMKEQYKVRKEYVPNAKNINTAQKYLFTDQI